MALAHQEAEDIQILQTIWPALRSPDFSRHPNFCKFVVEQSGRLRDDSSPLTPANLLKALRIVHDFPTETKYQLWSRLVDISEGLPMDDIELLLETCARISTTSWISGRFYSLSQPDDWAYYAVWTDDQSIKDAILAYFGRDAVANTEGQLEPGISGVSLMSSCGIRIMWTSNLLDHLLLDRSARTVKVYKHPALLLTHMSAMDPSMLRIWSSQGYQLFPDELLEETVDTLSLLFPPAHDATRKFLLKQEDCFDEANIYRSRVSFHISRYRFWGSRLRDLNSFYKNPPLDCFSQIFLWGRNKWEIIQRWGWTLGIVFGGGGFIWAMYQLHAAAKVTPALHQRLDTMNTTLGRLDDMNKTLGQLQDQLNAAHSTIEHQQGQLSNVQKFLDQNSITIPGFTDSSPRNQSEQYLLY